MRGKSAKRIDFTVKRRQILAYAGEITRHQRQIKVKMTDPRTLRGNTKKNDVFPAKLSPVSGGSERHVNMMIKIQIFKERETLTIEEAF